MDFEIISIDPKSLKENEWLEIHELFDTLFRELYSDEPTPNRDTRQKSIIQEDPVSISYYWLAKVENKIVGISEIHAVKPDSPNYEINGPHTDGNIRILPKYRRKGIGTKMLKIMTELCHEQEKQTLIIGSSHTFGFEFMQHFGGKVAYEGTENRLTFSDIDWNLMKNWVKEGEDRSPNSQILYYTKVPDNHLNSFVNFQNEVVNTQPLGDMDFRFKTTPKHVREEEEKTFERGIERKAYMVIEENGEISGYTDRYYNPNETHKIYIGFTGVHPKYRGRGIGKWLKAKMAIYLNENYPDLKYEITGNADTNEAMLGINRKMGFKPYVSGKVYKFQIKELYYLFHSI